MNNCHIKNKDKFRKKIDVQCSSDVKYNEYIMTSLRTNTTQHYMGVYVDELYELLSNEILAGMCFECEDENANKIEKYQGNSHLNCGNIYLRLTIVVFTKSKIKVKK